MSKLDQWYITHGVDHNWRKVPGATTAPEQLTQHLSGIISKDERFDDGTPVTTSTIVGRRREKVVTRSGTEYDLLQPCAAYEKQFPDAKMRLLMSLPDLDDKAAKEKQIAQDEEAAMNKDDA